MTTFPDSFITHLMLLKVQRSEIKTRSKLWCTSSIQNQKIIECKDIFRNRSHYDYELISNIFMPSSCSAFSHYNCSHNQSEINLCIFPVWLQIMISILIFDSGSLPVLNSISIEGTWVNNFPVLVYYVLTVHTNIENRYCSCEEQMYFTSSQN